MHQQDQLELFRRGSNHISWQRSCKSLNSLTSSARLSADWSRTLTCLRFYSSSFAQQSHLWRRSRRGILNLLPRAFLDCCRPIIATLQLIRHRKSLFICSASDRRHPSQHSWQSCICRFHSHDLAIGIQAAYHGHSGSRTIDFGCCCDARGARSCATPDGLLEESFDGLLFL